MIGLFTFEFNDLFIRVALKNNQPWFAAYDLCHCLHLPSDFVDIVDIDCLQTIFVPSYATPEFDYDQCPSDPHLDVVGIVCVNEAGLHELTSKLTELSASHTRIKTLLASLYEIEGVKKLLAVTGGQHA